MIARIAKAVLKVTAYAVAGVVILLAVALGLFRLFLPRLPEYQDDIKAWASAAIGMSVEFSGMDARWGLRGPEVEFYDAGLIAPDTNARLIAADQVSVGIGLGRLLVDRRLVVERVIVRESRIEIRQLDGGDWAIQGTPVQELLPERTEAPTGAGFEVTGEDIEIAFLQPGDPAPRLFRVPSVVVSRDRNRLAIDATVEPPGDLGRGMFVGATQRVDDDGEVAWDVAIDIEGIDLAGVSRLHPQGGVEFSAGSGNVGLDLEIVRGALQAAGAEVNLDGIATAGEPGIGISGVFEYRRNDDGWLVAGNDVRLRTGDGPWPAATLRIEAGTDTEGALLMLDAEASYLRLDDYPVLAPWLPADRYDLVAGFDPSGIVRNLSASVAGLGNDSPRFDVSADLEEVGIAAAEGRPGVRGFSGNLRADQSGGRLHMDAPGMSVASEKFLGDVVYLDEASGTVIWRRSDNRTTLLSDSIVLRNEEIGIEANIEASLADGGAPIVDIAATWNIADLATARRLIPYIPRIPRTSEWFQEGLLGGRIQRGTARLYGPLDRFPFDAGEGLFRIEAEIEDGSVMYQRRWPTARVLHARLVVENTRLYSTENRLIIAGNQVNDASIEIGDFRAPVLRVRAATAGPIEAVQRLLIQSPVGTDFFGGKLERVAVTGDGSFDLDLTVPIRDWRSFDFAARLRASDATLSLSGFPATLTEVGGIVDVGRETIGSESLGGIFLGRPVAIELEPAPESMAGFRVVASASGVATADSLVAELGLPLEGRTSGETPYRARLLFPRGRVEEPQPFTIEIDTGLEGLAVDLPQPLHKSAEDRLPVSGIIRLPAGGEQIASSGTAAGLMAWDVTFDRQDGQWALERGTVDFGAEPLPPGIDAAETRGLHLRGTIDEIFMQDWFDLAKRGPGMRPGTSTSIRSADLNVANLHIIGQHLVDHRVRIDRSARDWLVQFDGKDVIGNAEVPYDFRSGRELVIDMKRMVLPGETVTAPSQRPDIDPRTLPPITVRAEEFALGNRFFGTVEASFRHTVDGLQAEGITAKDESFEITGSGGWVVDESDPRGSRSYVRAALKSRDVDRTMRRLGYEPGIVAEDADFNLDLNWSGGPRADFMETLDGEVRVRIGTGQLSDVEPGAGRMFGLMSIVALPRRLALDFRDVFSKGFGFDRIDGNFRIEDGDTYTCDLSLTGPAADIGIVGRAGLVTRDYDQVAVVNANFGNTLPVVGGVLGGPQIAAVMLIFSQIFKKPLQEATQIYYGITGSWDEPVIESSSARRLADHAALSGCIANAE